MRNGPRTLLESGSVRVYTNPIRGGFVDFIWGLSYIPLPAIGPLGRTCAALARTCARTVAQKLVFVDLGLRSFRVDCAQAFLSSVFVVLTATHKDFSR